MNKRKECCRVFEDFKNVKYEYIRVGNLIERLNACVQNPDFMCKEDFDLFKNECIMVNKEIKELHENSLNELKGLYKRVKLIYEDVEYMGGDN